MVGLRDILGPKGGFLMENEKKYLRKVLDLVVKYNASMIILAHNHPDGNAYPSMEDIETTSDLMATFNMVDVRLLEHYVVSNNDYYTIIHSTDTLKRHSKDNRDFFRRSLLEEYNK